jgi:membrane-bound metal-dependent hydrolase YbcI (DUF457 family)
VPFTPFHFGPGLLVKAASPRRISALAFAAANVAVDSEVAFNLLRGHHPRHGIVHTILVAGPLGLVVGLLAVWAVRRWFPRTVAAHPLLREDSSMVAGAIGGLLGGASHPLLDAIGRKATHPFWPWSMSNPLFGIVPYWSLIVSCIAAGLLGYWILRVRSRRTGKPATR